MERKRIRNTRTEGELQSVPLLTIPEAATASTATERLTGYAPTTAPKSEPAPELTITEHDGRVTYDGPYTVEGSSVLNASGVRVAIAGYDTTRAASGPGMARLIADSLNKAILR